MKRAILIGAAATAALTLAACNRTETTDAAQAPVSAAQDAMAGPVGQMSAATLGSYDTPSFVSNAAQSDMYEIQAGQIAQTRSNNADIKAFATMMVTDHTAMTNQMKPLIAAAGQTPPAGLDERRQGLIDNLNTADAAAFDKVYVDQQVNAHEEALTLMRGYAEKGDNAALKDAAAKAAPKIQAHLDKIKGIQSAMN